MNSIFRPYQLLHLTRALALELLREPGVLFWGIVFPVLMALGLGFAFTKKPVTVRKVAVIESVARADSSVTTRPFHNWLEMNSIREEKKAPDDYSWKAEFKDNQLGDYIFLFYRMQWDEAMVMLKRGTVSLIVDDSEGKTEYHFDPLSSEAHLTYMKLAAFTGNDSVTVNQSAAQASVRPMTVPGTRYIDFLLPGLITMGVMMSCMWGISYGIIEKRSKKLLRRMVATPMKKSHFLIALITVRIVMNFIEAIILILFAMLVFDVKIQGNIFSLLAVYFAGNVAFSGIAVFVSSHTSNTEVGNGLINVVVMPMMVLSGIFFSYQNFPGWSLPVIRNLPLTMMTDGVRSIFNEGAGFTEVTIPAIILFATGAAFFAAGLKIFRWY